MTALDLVDLMKDLVKIVEETDQGATWATMKLEHFDLRAGPTGLAEKTHGQCR